jgi:hypothetical protein
MSRSSRLNVFAGNLQAVSGGSRRWNGCPANHKIMNTIFWIIFIAGNALFWLGSWMDYSSSMKQVSHGLAENDVFKINRDKYGYFAPQRFWTAHLIYWGIFTAIALIMYAYDTAVILAIFGGMFLVAGGVSAYKGYRNNGLAENSRKNVQIPILERLLYQSEYNYDAVESVFTGKGFWKRRVAGRIRAVMFPWLYMDGGNDEQFEDKFYREIWTIAQKGKAQWFSDTRMRALS